MCALFLSLLLPLVCFSFLCLFEKQKKTTRNKREIFSALFTHTWKVWRIESPSEREGRQVGARSLSHPLLFRTTARHIFFCFHFVVHFYLAVIVVCVFLSALETRLHFHFSYFRLSLSLALIFWWICEQQRCRISSAKTFRQKVSFVYIPRTCAE